MGIDALCTNAIEITLVSSSLVGQSKKAYEGVSITAQAEYMVAIVFVELPHNARVAQQAPLVDRQDLEHADVLHVAKGKI